MIATTISFVIGGICTRTGWHK